MSNSINKLYQIKASGSDYEWFYERIVGTFTNKDVADLVCECLASNKKLCDYNFLVEDVEVIKAESESRVNGIVKNIISNNWPDF